jgi:hypothetical protein
MHRWGKLRGEQRWICAERNRTRRSRMTPAQRERERETYRERYYALDGLAYNRFLLRCRRNKALARMRKREVA